MAMLVPITDEWECLPPSPQRLSSNGPIGVGLMAALYPAGGLMIDAVRLVRPTADTGTRRNTPLGVLRDYTGGQKTTFANSASYGLTGPMTIVVVCDVDALSNYGALVSCQDTASTNGWEFRLGAGPTDSNIVSHRAHASGYTQFRASTASHLITAGTKNNFLAVTYPTADIYTSAPTFYVNGLSYSGNYLGGGATGSATASTSTLDIGARAAGTTQLDGAVSFVGLWDRALSAPEIAMVRQAWPGLLDP